MLGAADSKKDATKKEVTKLAGTWLVKSIETDGQNVTDELVLDVLKDVKIKVEDDEMTLVQGTRNLVGVTFELYIEAMPKCADFKPAEDVFGVFNGESMWGIYELDDNVLKLCVSIRTAVKERPTEFKTKPDSGLYLLELKRE